MRIAMFYHSLVSDWNHGNAHFLRGVANDLTLRGHELRIFEPVDSWSRQNLLHEHGAHAVERFSLAYPLLRSELYDDSLDLDSALDGVDLVLVHEWNTPGLVKAIGEHRTRAGYRLLFHDTHHRSVTAPAEIARYDLRNYDGVLAFGDVVRDIYIRNAWTQRAWTWHEAADVTVFRPPKSRPEPPVADLVWVGNWGDEERTAELHEFLIDPVREIGITATVHGVRYPAGAIADLRNAGLAYAGWVANFDVPDVFARHRVTVHVPRRPYVRALPGIPTIRPFEALSCGIPLVSAPWDDVEGLFRPGDFLVARNGAEMQRQLRALLNDSAMAADIGERGRQTILARHTCSHRVDQLLSWYEEIAPAANSQLASTGHSFS